MTGVTTVNAGGCVYEIDLEMKKAVLKSGRCAREELVVPRVVKGKEGEEYVVVKVGGAALMDQTKVKRLVFPDDSEVTCLESECLDGMDGLTEITIPAKMTDIENMAFKGVPNLSVIHLSPNNTKYVLEDGVLYTKNMDTVLLVPRTATKVNLPPGLRRFAQYSLHGCVGITEVTIGEKVNDVAAYSLSGSGIEQLSVPSTLGRFGEGALADCEHLKTVTFAPDAKIRAIPKSCFRRCHIESLTIPKSVQRLEAKCFEQMYELSELKFEPGSELTEIKDDVFRCSGLTSLTLPHSLEKLAPTNFFSCPKLATIQFDDAAKARFLWKEDALWDKAQKTLYFVSRASSVVKLKIPVDVLTIGENACHQCRSLQTIEWSAGGRATSIGEWAFAHSGLVKFNLPASVKSIGDCAFSNCYKLRLFEFAKESKLETIGASCFSFTGIGACDLPVAVKTLGRSAFSSSKLEVIRIPQNVKILEELVFYGCLRLRDVYVTGPRLTVKTDAFAMDENKPSNQKISITHKPDATIGMADEPENVIKQEGDVDVVIRPEPRKAEALVKPGTDFSNCLVEGTNYTKMSGKMAETLTCKIYKAVSSTNRVCVGKEFSKIDVEDRDLRIEVTALSKLAHPAILGLVGVSLPDDIPEIGKAKKSDKKLFSYPTILTEWMQNGSLDKHIYNAAWRKSVDATTIVKMALGIAHACAYIHKCQAVIRDLKPGNIFLTKDWTAKIGDLGSTTMCAEQTLSATQSGPAGFTPAYMAPEVANNQRWDNSVDVYSYCLIIWELIVGKKWYGEEKKETSVMQGKLVSGDLRVDVNALRVEWVRDLVSRGTEFSMDGDRIVSDRPTFDEIITAIMDNGGDLTGEGEINRNELEKFNACLADYAEEHNPGKVDLR